MSQLDQIRTLLCDDPARRRAFDAVRRLALPDCWIGAGFVRDATWDHVYGRQAAPAYGDVDVIWFDPLRTVQALDRDLQAELRRVEPAFKWSVKNQAPMHLRNGDPPYRSSEDAMRHWPETATAVAARMSGTGAIEIAAPFGLGDLLDGVLRPTPSFSGTKHPVFLDRVRRKRWTERWPELVVADHTAER